MLSQQPSHLDTKQGNALMDTNHSRSNAFQLSCNICSHSHSGALPDVPQPQSGDDERWMCKDLTPKRGKATEEIHVHKWSRCFFFFFIQGFEHK